MVWFWKVKAVCFHLLFEKDLRYRFILCHIMNSSSGNGNVTTLSGSEEDEFDRSLFQQLYAQGLKDSSKISNSLPIPKFYSKVSTFICDDGSHSLDVLIFCKTDP